MQTEKPEPINVTLTSLRQEIPLNGKTYVVIDKSQLQSLLNQIKENKADILEFKSCVLSILSLMGLLDEKTETLKESIKTGEEGYFGPILKSLSEVISLLGQAQIPIIGKKAEAKLVQKFAFIKNILPIVEKHANTRK